MSTPQSAILAADNRDRTNEHPVMNPKILVVMVGLACASTTLSPEAWAADPAQTRAKALMSAGDFQGAVDAYTQALAAAPEDAELLRERGRARNRLKDYRAAIADFDAAIARNPNDAQTLNLRGNADKGSGDSQAARADFERAMKIDPNFAAPYYNRGMLRRDAGDRNGALQDFDRALELAPRDELALGARASLQSQLGDSAGALADFDRALAINPKNKITQNNRGTLLFKLGRIRESLASFDAAVALDAGDAISYDNRGLTRQKLGDTAGARSDFEQAVKLDPKNSPAQKHLATVSSTPAENPVAVLGELATLLQPAAAIAPSPPSTPETVTDNPAATPKPAANVLPPSDASASALGENRREPPASPLVLSPRLSATNITPTQFAGAVSAVVEAMRSLQGPLSADDTRQFEAKWAPFYDFPTPEAVAYLNALLPLLQEYLALRSSVPMVSGELDASWREAVMVSTYNNEVATREALAIARQQQMLLQSMTRRIADIGKQIDALGDPPDATQAKTRVRAHHDEALKVTQPLLPVFRLAPSLVHTSMGEPVTFNVQASNLPDASVIEWSYGDGTKTSSPARSLPHTYAKAGTYAVTAKLIQTSPRTELAAASGTAIVTPTMEGLVWVLQSVEPKLKKMKEDQYDALGSFTGDFPNTTEHKYTPETNGVRYVVTQYADVFFAPNDTRRVTCTSDLHIKYSPPPARLAVGTQFASTATYAIKQSGDPRAGSLSPDLWVVLHSSEQLSNLVADNGVHPGYFFVTGSIGFTTAMYPTFKFPYPFGIVHEKNIKYILPNEIGTREASGSFSEKLTAPQGKPGQTWRLLFELRMPSIQASGWHDFGEYDEAYTYVLQGESAAASAPAPVLVESASEVNRQRIEELGSNVAYIEQTLVRLRADRGQTNDPVAIRALEYQIMQAETGKLAEQDLIASLQSGQPVHTRSPFDAFAHDAFIANTRENQLAMQEAQREMAVILRLASMGEDADALRDFARKQLLESGAIARADFAAIRRVANALHSQVTGYWQRQGARGDEAALDAEQNIFAANSVIAASTIVVSAGLGEVGAVYAAPSWLAHAGTMGYAGTTGYIASGSVKEAMKASVAWSSTVGMVGVSAFDGYQDGGGWTGALKEAGKGLAIGWISGKASQLAVARIGGGPAFTVPRATGRMPTVREFANSREFRRDQAAGKAKVDAFERAQAELQTAGTSGASSMKIKELQSAVMQQANEVNADQHAKMFLLKSGQAKPATIRAYESYHRAIHATVESRFHELMAEKGFNPQEVQPVRNASSSGTAGMDYDLALVEGRPITRGGKRSNVSEWQREARDAYDRAFKEKTGRSAEQAWEMVTTSVNVEAYKDVGDHSTGKFEGWLADLRDPGNLAKLKGELAQQAADVTSVKGWEFRNNASMGEAAKLQEICRGTAKDMKTKLDPVLAAAKASTPTQQEALRQARAHWKQVQEVMEDFGANRIGPITARQKLTALTGKASIHEIIDDMGTMMEGAVKFGR
jgi:tetratricopeptide (TPR) repeat protein/PKD repeat protein